MCYSSSLEKKHRPIDTCMSIVYVNRVASRFPRPPVFLAPVCLARCAWRCNFVALILPCPLMAQHVYRRRQGFSISLAVLVAITLTWAWWPNFVLLKGDSWSAVLWLLQGAHFWIALLVAGTCCVISRRSGPLTLARVA
jgi:hypothetical protein